MHFDGKREESTYLKAQKSKLGLSESFFGHVLFLSLALFDNVVLKRYKLELFVLFPFENQGLGLKNKKCIVMSMG